MAEQEAVANVVANAVSESGDRTLQGESLLLPLLQELLDKKCAHTQSQPIMQRSASSQSSEESAAATVDSGTESGEELRLLAAGLCDSGIEPLGPGLLAEVQNALNKLAMSLQLQSPDVQIDPTKKNSLLQLVTRLQASLVVPSRPPAERRASSGQGRFAKHKNRQNRHTVGVSSEELAAARKLMEEVVLRDTLSTAAANTPEYVPTPPEYNLQKQLSDGSVASNHSYRSVNFSPQATTPVKNATAKPFFSSSESSSKSTSEPSTPGVTYRDKSSINTVRQTSLNLDDSNNTLGFSALENGRPASEYIPSTYNPTQVESWVQNPSGIRQTQNVKTPDFNLREVPESETDDDSSTVKHSEDYDDTRQSIGTTPTPLHYITDVKTISRTITPVNNDYIPITINEYKDDRYNNNNKDLSAAQRLLNIAMNDETKVAPNRFNNKKLKMKRANTIDIPKPLNYYENDDDSDDCILDEQPTSTRRSNYLALRGPIRVGLNSKSTVPTFEPKTENDKKFMAFIQKQNSSSSNVGSLWANKTEPVKKPGDQNWTRKFGNIKTIFEKDESTSRPSSTTVNSAKQFWQTADDAVNAGKRSYNGPKVSKQGTRQLQSLFEQKQQESKLPWSTTEHNNVVTGTLKVESNFKPIQNSQLIQGKNYKFVPQPLPVNKFDHAPMSAFKPPPKRTPVSNIHTPSFVYPSKQPLVHKEENGKSEPTTPLFLYTPKQLEFPVAQEEPKPTSAPWVGPGNQTEHRVLNLAAKRFENSSREMSPQPVKKNSKDKVYIPPVLQTNSVETKDLSSPFLVKNVQPTNKTVRKMSGEYDYSWHNNKVDNVVTYKQPVINPRPAPNVVQIKKEPERQIQTVKQNVQKFSGVYDYNSKPSGRKTSEDYEVSHVNKQPERVVHNQSSRRLSGEFDFNHKVDKQPEKQTYQSYSQEKPSYQSYSQEPLYHQYQDSYHPDAQKPSKPSLLFDFPSSESSASRSASTTATPDNLDEPEPVSSPLTEYKAVSKVMTGPVSQQAVTVSQNTPKKREEHDMAAMNLKHVLKISMTDNEDRKKDISPKQSFKIEQTEKPKVLSRTTKSYAQNKPQVAVNAKPFSTESLEINDDGESIVTTKLQIPVSRNVYYNNTDPNKMQKRVTLDEVETTNRRLSPQPPTFSKSPQPLSKSPQPLSKSDSWHRLTDSPTVNKPSSRASPKARNILQKAKSSHSLAVPKQFEAGIARDEVEVKKKTIAAYFGPAQIAPSNNIKKEVHHSVNRTKTSQKLSTQSRGSTLSRSRTMPEVADLFEAPLDIDTEFENIFRASIAK